MLRHFGTDAMVVVDIEIALGLVKRNEVDGTPALLSISCAMPPVGESRWRAPSPA